MAHVVACFADVALFVNQLNSVIHLTTFKHSGLRLFQNPIVF